ncbi:MAG: hypothetical protein RLZZ546_399 [Bacteroidota bacterium]|jgi:hypothetical protein
MKISLLYFLPLFVNADCSPEDFGLVEVLPRSSPEQTVIENPDTEPSVFETNAVNTWDSSTSETIGIASYFPPTSTETIFIQSTECPFHTTDSTFVVQSTPLTITTETTMWYTSYMSDGSLVVQSTPVVENITTTTDTTIYTTATLNDSMTYTTEGTIVVQSVSSVPCEPTPMTTPCETIAVQSIPSVTQTITSTFTINNVTKTTCDYSIETIRMDIIKTIYVQTCVNDSVAQVFGVPQNTTYK